MKSIIKRNLPLDTHYTLIDKTYISLIDGLGCTCDNCGKLIANIATVKNDDNKTFSIGFDCLETFLINNNLLDNLSVDEYKEFKKQLPTILKHAKKISSDIKEYNIKYIAKCTAIEFDINNFNYWRREGSKSYLNFNLIINNKKENTGIKVNYNFNVVEFMRILSKMLPNIEIKIYEK